MSEAESPTAIGPQAYAGWRATARFRTPGELRTLLQRAGLSVTAIQGAVYYPPANSFARLLAPLDPWPGRLTRSGAAFFVRGAVKP